MTQSDEGGFAPNSGWRQPRMEPVCRERRDILWATSIGWVRWLLVMLVATLPLPWAWVRTAVIGACVVAIALCEMHPNTTFGRMRLPVAASGLVAIAVTSVFWSVSVGDSIPDVGQLISVFLLAVYFGFRLPLGDVHAAVAGGFKFFLVGSLVVEALAWLGYPLYEEARALHGGALGATANPNLLAFSAVLAGVAIGTLPRSRFLRPAHKAIWVLLSIGAVWTAGSDGGMIYLTVSVLLAFAFRALRTSGALSPPLFVAMLLPLPFVLFNADLQGALLGLVGISQNVTVSGRTLIWEASVNAINVVPLTGYGLGSLTDPSLAPTMELAAVWRALKLDYFNAHNGYLDVALQLGIPGLLLALVVLVGAFVHYFRRQAKSPSFVWATLTLATLLTYNLTESRIVTPPNAWFIVALLAAAAVNREREPEDRRTC